MNEMFRTSVLHKSIKCVQLIKIVKFGNFRTDMVHDYPLEKWKFKADTDYTQEIENYNIIIKYASDNTSVWIF